MVGPQKVPVFMGVADWSEAPDLGDNGSLSVDPREGVKAQPLPLSGFSVLLTLPTLTAREMGLVGMGYETPNPVMPVPAGWFLELVSPVSGKVSATTSSATDRNGVRVITSFLAFQPIRSVSGSGKGPTNTAVGSAGIFGVPKVVRGYAIGSPDPIEMAIGEGRPVSYCLNAMLCCSVLDRFRLDSGLVQLVLPPICADLATAALPYLPRSCQLECDGHLGAIQIGLPCCSIHSRNCHFYGSINDR